MRVVQFLLACAVLLVSLFLTSPHRAARALPAAGSDRLPVVATVDIASRLGDATVVLTGWAEIDRQTPHDEGGVDVVDLEIVSMDLVGASSIGVITVRERPNAGPDYVSSGEIRSKQAGQDFPASSFFDLFVEVIVPASPGDTVEAHNEAPLHLTAREGSAEVNLAAWPPLGITYKLEPIFEVDNDGDGLIDEDTADDDGDGLIDEDPIDGLNNDVDGLIDEDPPISQCTLVLCDQDGDGQMDEDPSCIPLMNPGNVNNMKAGYCVRDLTLEIAPELPSFSVAPGGPSGLHPADILALTPGASLSVPDPLSLVACNDDAPYPHSQVSFPALAGETYRIQIGSWDGTAGGVLTLNVFATAGSPAPTSVSGNDSFANAWPIPAIPFLSQQSTVGFTTETGEPNTLSDSACAIGVGMSKTAWYSFTPSTTETITINTFGSDSVLDTVLAVYTGDGFGGASVGDHAPFVRIPCASLGLTAGGCDSAGSVDDLNALSYGDDLPVGAKSETNFSVGPGAQGAPGSAVEVQRSCPAPEPEPDVFSARLNGTNTQELDGNGPIGTCAGAFPLGLVEGASVRDDLNALYGQDPIVVDTDLNGVPDQAVYFSLDLASPSLTTYGLSAADVLRTVNGGQPTVYAAPAALGLEAGDDIDALCLRESGDGSYGAGDLLYFSLAPGSTTLGQIGAGPGDVLTPGSPNPAVVQSAALLGLLAGDDVDALKCLAFKDSDGDTDGDTILNSDDDDDDNDGCTDEQELGALASQGGQRNPHSFWDFFDVPTASGRDFRVDGFDIGAVVLRFGAFTEPPPSKEEAFAQALTPPPDMTSYHAAFDRDSPDLGANVWNVRPPNERIDGFDISFVVAQFGHTCA